MRFLIDANLPRSIVAALQRFGHDVESARDIGLGAASDPGCELWRPLDCAADDALRSELRTR